MNRLRIQNIPRPVPTPCAGAFEPSCRLAPARSATSCSSNTPHPRQTSRPVHAKRHRSQTAVTSLTQIRTVKGHVLTEQTAVRGRTEQCSAERRHEASEQRGLHRSVVWHYVTLNQHIFIKLRISKNHRVFSTLHKNITSQGLQYRGDVLRDPNLQLRDHLTAPSSSLSSSLTVCSLFASFSSRSSPQFS